MFILGSAYQTRPVGSLVAVSHPLFAYVATVVNLESGKTMLSLTMLKINQEFKVNQFVIIKIQTCNSFLD